jgi:hypothetical protein
VEPVRANAAEGTIIPLEFELFEDGKLVRSVAQSVLVNPSTDTDNDGEPDAFDNDNFIFKDGFEGNE